MLGAGAGMTKSGKPTTTESCPVTILHGEHGAYTLLELLSQPYQNCVFSGGFVEGHPVDTLYLRLAREGEEPTTLLLRPDEMAALAWCASGALWSEEMRSMRQRRKA